MRLVAGGSTARFAWGRPSLAGWAVPRFVGPDRRALAEGWMDDGRAMTRFLTGGRRPNAYFPATFSPDLQVKAARALELQGARHALSRAHDLGQDAPAGHHEYREHAPVGV
jgi:hypothetical protein